MTQNMALNKSTFTTRTIVMTGMMSAVATVIYYLDFNVPLMPGFIKLDFSNVISLLAGFSLGPVPGVIVCLIKNLIQLLVKGFGTTMGIGNIFDFVTSAVLVLTSSIIYQRNRTKKGAGIAVIFGVLAFSLITLPLNYFIVYPIYFKAYGGEQAVLAAYKEIMPSVKNIFAALCIFNQPFTFIKGVLCALIVMLIYKPLSPVIKGGRR
ncbi:MAG: ECF transporter S component [Ruminococcus sp.]|nr:ECF transporter S component [Ruminococcus sp.]MBR1822865.1 ECF transporter S component [Ruminococcus sp.]